MKFTLYLISIHLTGVISRPQEAKKKRCFKINTFVNSYYIILDMYQAGKMHAGNFKVVWTVFVKLGWAATTTVQYYYPYKPGC